MEAKKYTQFGTFTITILGAVALLFAIVLFNSIKSKGSDISTVVLFFILLTGLLICLLLFYRLTIIVDQTRVVFRMGIGVIGKSFRLSDIKSCTLVKDSFCLGINWIGNGWYYGVSGFKAIELKFKNRQSVVRIGTDRPEEICALIQNLIGEGTVYEQSNITEIKKITPRRILIMVFALCIAGLIIYNNSETRIRIDNNNFSINGLYGMTIPLNKIQGIDTLSILPTIEMKLSGYTFARTKIGKFRLTDKSIVKLFIKTGHPPYIRIWIKDTVPVYINFRDRQKTLEVYRELFRLLEK